MPKKILWRVDEIMDMGQREPEGIHATLSWGRGRCRLGGVGGRGGRVAALLDVGPRQLTLPRPTFPGQEGCRVGGVGKEKGWLMAEREEVG